MQVELFVSLLLIVLALLIIAVTVSAAVWDGRRNRPRAEREVSELAVKVGTLPQFAVGEFSAQLDDSRAMLRQKRYRECIRRTGESIGELEQLMEVVRQGRAELHSIEAKVEEAEARGLGIDRGAIGLDGVSRFWRQGQ